eukprot:g541.t1
MFRLGSLLSAHFFGVSALDFMAPREQQREYHEKVARERTRNKMLAEGEPHETSFAPTGFMQKRKAVEVDHAGAGPAGGAVLDQVPHDHRGERKRRGQDHEVSLGQRPPPTTSPISGTSSTLHRKELRAFQAHVQEMKATGGFEADGALMGATQLQEGENVNVAGGLLSEKHKDELLLHDHTHHHGHSTVHAFVEEGTHQHAHGRNTQREHKEGTQQSESMLTREGHGHGTTQHFEEQKQGQNIRQKLTALRVNLQARKAEYRVKLQAQKTIRGRFTVRKCEKACRDHSTKTKFFAVQHGSECFCGYAKGFERYGKMPETDCQEPAGSPKCIDPATDKFCGGAWRNAVYALGGRAGETSSSAKAGAMSFVGCFEDKKKRAMPNRRHGSLTVRQCEEECSNLSGEMKFFALQYGAQCFCDDGKGFERYGEKPERDCQGPGKSPKCKDPGTDKFCGGPWRNAVYTVEGRGGESSSATALAVVNSQAAKEVDGMSFVGCFEDKSQRAMRGPRPDGRLTVRQCEEECRKKAGDMRFFALQFGTQCFCDHGKGFQQYGEKPETDCQEPAGSPKCIDPVADKFCGGSWRNAVYTVKGRGGASSSATALTMVNSGQAATVGTMSFVGCFEDKSQRAMRVRISGRWTVRQCEEKCRMYEGDMQFFALQFGTQCFCDNGKGFQQYGEKPEGDCQGPGNSPKCISGWDKFCGGPWRNAVYTIGGRGGGTSSPATAAMVDEDVEAASKLFPFSYEAAPRNSFCAHGLRSEFGRLGYCDRVNPNKKKKNPLLPRGMLPVPPEVLAATDGGDQRDTRGLRFQGTTDPKLCARACELTPGCNAFSLRTRPQHQNCCTFFTNCKLKRNARKKWTHYHQFYRVTTQPPEDDYSNKMHRLRNYLQAILEDEFGVEDLAQLFNTEPCRSREMNGEVLVREDAKLDGDDVRGLLEQMLEKVGKLEAAMLGTTRKGHATRTSTSRSNSLTAALCRAAFGLGLDDLQMLLQPGMGLGSRREGYYRKLNYEDQDQQQEQEKQDEVVEDSDFTAAGSLLLLSDDDDVDEENTSVGTAPRIEAVERQASWDKIKIKDFNRAARIATRSLRNFDARDGYEQVGDAAHLFDAEHVRREGLKQLEDVGLVAKAAAAAELKAWTSHAVTAFESPHLKPYRQDSDHTLFANAKLRKLMTTCTHHKHCPGLADKYLGCYADAEASPAMRVNKTDAPPQKCAFECRNYLFFAVQDGRQCYCSNDFEWATKYGPASGSTRCEKSCANDIRVPDGEGKIQQHQINKKSPGGYISLFKKTLSIFFNPGIGSTSRTSEAYAKQMPWTRTITTAGVGTSSATVKDQSFKGACGGSDGNAVYFNRPVMPSFWQCSNLEKKFRAYAVTYDLPGCLVRGLCWDAALKVCYHARNFQDAAKLSSQPGSAEDVEDPPDPEGRDKLRDIVNWRRSWKYHGCYAESDSGFDDKKQVTAPRSYELWQVGDFTLDQCAFACREHRFFAMVTGSSCFCSDRSPLNGFAQNGHTRSAGTFQMDLDEAFMQSCRSGDTFWPGCKISDFANIPLDDEKGGRTPREMWCGGVSAHAVYEHRYFDRAFIPMPAQQQTGRTTGSTKSASASAAAVEKSSVLADEDEDDDDDDEVTMKRGTFQRSYANSLLATPETVQGRQLELSRIEVEDVPLYKMPASRSMLIGGEDSSGMPDHHIAAPSFVGCFEDKRERAMSVRISGRRTVRQCEEECRKQPGKMKFFALQFGTECRCGDGMGFRQYGEKPEADCQQPAGSPKCVDPKTDKFCGGAWRNAVYTVRGREVTSWNGSGGKRSFSVLDQLSGTGGTLVSDFEFVGCFSDFPADSSSSNVMVKRVEDFKPPAEKMSHLMDCAKACLGTTAPGATRAAAAAADDDDAGQAYFYFGLRSYGLECYCDSRIPEAGYARQGQVADYWCDPGVYNAPVADDYSKQLQSQLQNAAAANRDLKRNMAMPMGYVNQHRGGKGYLAVYRFLDVDNDFRKAQLPHPVRSADASPQSCLVNGWLAAADHLLDVVEADGDDGAAASLASAGSLSSPLLQAGRELTQFLLNNNDWSMSGTIFPDEPDTAQAVSPSASAQTQSAGAEAASLKNQYYGPSGAVSLPSVRRGQLLVLRVAVERYFATLKAVVYDLLASERESPVFANAAFRQFETKVQLLFSETGELGLHGGYAKACAGCAELTTSRMTTSSSQVLGRLQEQLQCFSSEVKRNRDFNGNDLNAGGSYGRVRGHLPHYRACMEECAKHEGCSGITFVKSMKAGEDNCALKNGKVDWSQPGRSSECCDSGRLSDACNRGLGIRGRFTVRKCEKACKEHSANMQFFAIQFGTQCFCGYAKGFERYGKKPETDCQPAGSPKCIDPVTDKFCGGPWRNAVYALGGRGGASSSATALITGNSQAAKADAMSFVGCFEDKSQRAMPVRIQGRLTVRQCEEECRKQSRGTNKFFALQHGTQCFCDKDGEGFERYGEKPERDCQGPGTSPKCVDTKTDNFCGGAWRNAVYTVGERPLRRTTTRLCTWQDLHGQEGPGVYGDAGDGSWWRPLTHHEDDANRWPGRCSHTAQGSKDNPGYWFVQFKDGKKHHVSTIRLWNRADCCQNRLNSACVRFSVDGSKPSNADASQNCDDYLPANIASSSGLGSGTEVVINRAITGMMFITKSNDYHMTIGGIEIYEDRTAMTTTTSTARLLTWQDFHGQQGPGVYGDGAWWRPLTHHEDDSNSWPGRCSHTDGGNKASPGYWFVKFKDGKKHHVSKIRLWNRAGCCPHRLNDACVRFSYDGSMPSNADPGENCDDYLPGNILSNSGPGSGTEVVIDRSITGMMFITKSNDYVMTIGGIEIYEQDELGYQGPSATSTSATRRLLAINVARENYAYAETAGGVVDGAEEKSVEDDVTKRERITPADVLRLPAGDPFVAQRNAAQLLDREWRSVVETLKKSEELVKDLGGATAEAVKYFG